MAGAALTSYADFFASTGSAVFGGPEDIVNDAQINAPSLARFIAGKDLQELLKGGKNITGAVMLDESNTAQNHLPGASFSWQNPQVLDYWTAPWRFTMDHASIIEQEWMLNSPEQMTGMGRFQQLKSIQFKVEQRAKTSLYNFMSPKLWAEPDTATMEATGAAGTEQYSIAAFVNEYALGQYNSAGTAGTAWTTVEGINPTTAGNARWAPRSVLYNSASTGQITSASPATTLQNDMIAAFDKMFRRIQYRNYQTFEQYTTQSPLDKVFIATSERGIVHFEQSCRDRQDRFIQANDPSFPGVNYRGIPVEYHQELDTATLYPNHLTLASATDNVTEGNSGSANANMGLGPRYYWLSPRFLTVVFHKERYFYKRKPLTPPDQPEAVVVPISCWWNMTCSSRRRLGIVSPGTASLFPPYTNGS